MIIATRDCEPPDFFEVLQRHNLVGLAPNPSVGGWGKFIRDFISKERRFTKRGRPVPSKPERKGKEKQQLRKGGRGWLHFNT